MSHYRRLRPVKGEIFAHVAHYCDHIIVSAMIWWNLICKFLSQKNWSSLEGCKTMAAGNFCVDEITSLWVGALMLALL